MRHALRGILVLTLGLAGCGLFENNPYSDFSVGKLNEEGPEAQAAILVGDPQVITRETLINDRLREVAHIEKLLNESKDLTFTPQLQRDLSVMQAFAAELGISFNPALGTAFERNEDIANLKADIEVVKLQNEIEQLKKLQTSDPANAALKPTSTDPTPPPGVTDPSTSEIKTQLAAAVARADAILKSLTPEGKEGARARETDVKASPEDHFEDLNAYRARLRQRQSEVALDDAHDTNGNTLYRLQFTATVLPGAVKEKFGVLDLEVAPAQASEEEINQLYDDLLITLGFRSLEIRPLHDALFWERAQALLIRQGLVKRVLLFDMPTRDGKQFTVSLFVYPDDQDLLIRLFENSADIATSLSTETESLKNLSPSVLALDSRSCALGDGVSRSLADAYELASAIERSKRSLRAIEIFLSSSISDEDAEVGGRVTLMPDAVVTLMGDLNLAVQASNQLRYYVEARLQKEQKRVKDCIREVESVSTPKEFFDAVSFDDGGIRRWKGEAFTYQAQPTERVQRLSTLASAVNSMQAAFSLAATIPNSGIGLQAGAGAARNAAGTAEAIERTPLVIGYTDRRGTNDATQSARFGYLFGPKAILDPEAKQVEYRQVAASHAVYADLSVPAWWPEFELKARSAWVANWYTGTEVLGTTNSDRVVPVRLRPQRDGIESMLGFLTKQPLVEAFEELSISKVMPDSVSACVDEIEFVIEGENLWRNPRVFLRGNSQESLAVLPDMDGIVATFDINDLPHPATISDREDLIVWTSLGRAIAQISILETRKDRPCPGLATGSGEIVLEPGQPRIHGGAAQKLKVNLLAPLPPAARQVKVIASLTPFGSQPLESVTANPTEAIPGKAFVGTYTLAKPDEYGLPAVDGAPLRVGLSYQLLDGGETKKAWAAKPIVYYPTEAESKFKVENAAIKDLDETVILERPANLTTAYPGFKTVEAAFAAKAKESDKAVIEVTADWTIAANKVAVSFDLKEDPDGTLVKAWCAKPIELTLSLTDAAGPDRPEVSSKIAVAKLTGDACKK